jgi:hypothetical protein
MAVQAAMVVVETAMAVQAALLILVILAVMGLAEQRISGLEEPL